MVKATRKEAPKVPQPPDNVDLEMDLATARALRTVLGLVGGVPSNSPRGLVDEVGEALQRAGIYGDFTAASGSVYFLDYAERKG